MEFCRQNSVLAGTSAAHNLKCATEVGALASYMRAAGFMLFLSPASAAQQFRLMLLSKNFCQLPFAGRSIARVKRYAMFADHSAVVISKIIKGKRHLCAVRQKENRLNRRYAQSFYTFQMFTVIQRIHITKHFIARPAADFQPISFYFIDLIIVKLPGLTGSGVLQKNIPLLKTPGAGGAAHPKH